MRFLRLCSLAPLIIILSFIIVFGYFYIIEYNENQKIIAEEIDADGVEISVHINPAPDHSMVQGRQFTTNQYDKNGK